MVGIEVFKKHLREKRAIKIDTGICNVNIQNIAKIARAAQNGKASALDICANKEAYKTAKQNSKLPIFVSSLHPFELLEAVKWGANAIEIGNFSALYKKGFSFSADEVYDITLETMGLINKYDVFTSVTIPGCIDIKDQIKLTRKFEILGIDLIQTEGLKHAQNQFNKHSAIYSDDINALIENTTELTNSTILPIMASGIIDNKNINEVFNCGASAISTDLSVLKDTNETMLTTLVMTMVSAISYRNSLNKEIVRTQRELTSF